MWNEANGRAASQPLTATETMTGAVPAPVDALPAAAALAPAGLTPDAAANATPPLLAMDADPYQVVPGDVISYSIAITNAADAPLEGVVLDNPLPAGVVYVAQSATGFSYSLRDNRLSWSMGALAAGQTVRGGFQLRAAGLAVGQLITNSVSAASANAAVVTASAVVEVAPPRQNRVWATPGEGGWLRSEDRRVDLRAPAGAVQGRTELRYAAESGLALPEHLLYAFRLEASDEGGQPVSQFAGPLTLSAFFDPRSLPAGGLDRLALFHLNEESGEWELAPSQIDRRWRRVVGQVEHFGVYGLGVDDASTALSYGAQHLPTVHGFVSDAWTGNSSVSYPIALPPGPGGLGLNLGLSYSSEGVNSIRQGSSVYDEQSAKTFARQAGMAGWGWSLSGLGQITMNLSNGKAYLGYAGGGFELKYTTAAGWQTEPQSFLRIQHDDNGFSGNPWVIWTPDGTRYTFGSGGWGNGVAWVYNTGSCGRLAREMHLTEVLDSHGNRAVISYDNERKGIWCDNNSNQDYVRAIRPTKLETIPANQTLASVRVVFNYGARSDTGIVSQNDPYVQSFWSAWRLSAIDVQVRNGAAVDSFATARSYQLTPAYFWADETDHEGLLLLAGITEKGSNGGSLPAWTFTYETSNGWMNHTLLKTASNGQGGLATFEYAAQDIWIGGCGAYTQRFRVSTLILEDGLGQAPHNLVRTSYGYSMGYAVAGGFPECRDDFEFYGYGQVTHQVSDGAGAVVQVVEDYFHQCGSGTPPAACSDANPSKDPRQGKVWKSVVRPSVGGGALQQQELTWSTQTVQGRNWVYKANETRWLGGVAQKSAYEYQPANQGGVQYGNLTHVRTYSDGGSTLLRTAETEYLPVVTGAYIINRPKRQRLWTSTNICQGEVRYSYDDQGYGAAFSKGDLTRTETALTLLDASNCGGSWSTASYGYDLYGNQTSATDPNGRTMTTTYDTTPGSWPMLYSLPTSTTQPTVNGLFFITTYAWDKVLGQVTAATDPNGAVTSYVYDEWGRQTKQILPDDTTAHPTVRTSYHNYASSASPYAVKEERRDNASKDASGNPIAATYLESWTYYDGLGRAVQSQREASVGSQSIVASTRFTAQGLVARSNAPYYAAGGLGVYRTPDWSQAYSETAYDALGRVTRVTQPGNQQVCTFYQGLRTAVVNERNYQTIRETDSLGRLMSVKNYLGAVGAPGAVCPSPNWNALPNATTTYVYDVADRLIEVRSADGATTRIFYDLGGRKTQMMDPDMGAWSYGYDLAGNLARQTDARNQRICYYYDALNRLKGKSYSTGAAACPADPGSYTVSYSYDAGTNGKGRRTGMVDGSGSATWEYDVRGRMTKETKIISGAGGGTFVTRWNSYDAMDRVRTMQYPDGEGVTFSYTAQGPIKTVYGSLTYYVGNTLYNALGQVTDRYLGSTTGVIRQQYSYTSAENFRLTTLKSGANNPGYNNLQNISYSYDNAGNVLTIADSTAYGGSQTQTFTYDALNRLLTACTLNGAACATVDGSYGAYSQRSYVYNPAGNITTFEGATLGYNDAAHKHAVTHVAGTQRYWYDANGNATQRVNGSQTVTLAYDAENHVTSITGSGVSATYVYDGDGKRVKATVGGVTTVYVGNTYERDNGTTIRKYYNAGAVRVAIRTGGNTFYLLNDHLTSTAITTNSSGVRQTELRYYAYGGTRYDAGGQMTLYRYTGQRVETGTGLYDYGARWFDPLIGRFLSADTIVPEPGDSQALNRYMYVGGNPLKYVDPSGHGWVIPPPFQPILHVLEDYGLLNPMAPYYLLPTALGGHQQQREAATGEEASEALAMTADWYFEQGSPDRELGLDSEITQALIRDEGVAQARQVYMQGGNRDIPGEAPHNYVFGLRDAAREFQDVVKSGDWSTSFLGGYQVQIKTESVEARYTIAEFTVTNETGWRSATRVWGISFKQNEDRRDPGPGGTMIQTYRWRERVPRRANTSHRGAVAQ